MNIGDKVFRKGGNTSYLVGSVVAVDRKGRVQVAWPSNRIGGDGTMKTWLQPRRLELATEEEIARRRADELERRRQRKVELEAQRQARPPAGRRWRCNHCWVSFGEEDYQKRQCPHCGKRW